MTSPLPGKTTFKKPNLIRVKDILEGKWKRSWRLIKDVLKTCCMTSPGCLETFYPKPLRMKTSRWIQSESKVLSFKVFRRPEINIPMLLCNITLCIASKLTTSNFWKLFYNCGANCIKLNISALLKRKDQIGILFDKKTSSVYHKNYQKCLYLKKIISKNLYFF